jgi:hypothetical protein
MGYRIIIALLAGSFAAQSQPNCTGAALDVDYHCACIKDPNSQHCAMVKAGFYNPHDFSKPNGIGLGGTMAPPANGTAAPSPIRSVAPARPQQARVVPLAHKDYLRFLPANAQLAAGIDFEKAFQSPELMTALFEQSEGDDSRGKVMGALKEMDHLWISFAPPNDIVVLMTGKFEQGVAAGMFYAQGIQPVFLGGAHAMMIGSEPSIQAALARLAKPAATGGWVARRARELSKDHETWIVTEPPPGTIQAASALPPIRQFALGFRLTGEAGMDGEVVTDSEASVEKIAAWVEKMKTGIREKTGVGALDSLTVERAGASLRFSVKDDSLMAGEAGKTAMSSDFGVEVYSVIMGGFPGMPSRTVAEDKLRAVKAGMQREEILSLLGPPLSVTSIQGLDTPRETWTYQIPFGRQLSVRLDGGVVSAPPR